MHAPSLAGRLGPMLALLVVVAFGATPSSAQLPRTTAPDDAVEAAEVPQDEWVAGQLCWAWYEPHSAWYAAHVVAVTADSIRVEHFDGFDETVVPARVRSDFVAVGDTVGAFYAPDGEWYQAVVRERRGMDVVVVYSDDEEETTWLKWIRVIAGDPAGGA